MNQALRPRKEFTLCPECDKLTEHHLLIHDLLEHAPLMGDISGGANRNWRTVPLKARVA